MFPLRWYFMNPFFAHEEAYNIFEKIKNWELRIIENKRLWELLEKEAKLKEIQKILQYQQLNNCCTITNKPWK